MTTKFAYLHDPNNPKRIITIARSLRPEEGCVVIDYGLAISRPGDKYSKEIGRRIAEGRMRKEPIVCELQDGIPAIVTVLTDMAQSIDLAFAKYEMQFLRRAVADRLTSMQIRFTAKQAQAKGRLWVLPVDGVMVDSLPK